VKFKVYYLLLGILLATVILFVPLPYYQEGCPLILRLDYNNKPLPSPPCIPRWRIGASLWQHLSGELEKPVSSYTSGVTGTATVAPTCLGPGRPGQVCTEPYHGIIKVINQDKTQEVTTFTTKDDGSFKVSLPSGEYYLVKGDSTGYPFFGGVGAKFRGVNVKVKVNSYTKVDLNFDTGIR